MPPDGFDGGEYTPRIDALLRDYPLPEGWSRPELFETTVEIAGVAVHLVGLCVRSDDGREILGSAASAESSPRERAFFELLERVSVVEAQARSSLNFLVVDGLGKRVGVLEHARIFPATPPGARYRYSVSNGVAAGSSFEGARRAALLELIERDRVLRSWYGAIIPVPLDEPEHGALERLKTLYAVESFSFPAPDSDVEVVAVFGFPREPGVPLIRGMGAGESLREAEARAARECLQNLGFLWGEELPREEPTFAAAPEYHQEYYLWPGSLAKLRRWLDGEHSRVKCVSTPLGRVERQARRFADLTLPHLAGRMRVLKALPERELPLIFGDGGLVEGALHRDLEVHPVS